MFRIGEFSKLSQVTVKALRHYDRIGLFQPAQVDSETGYRAYSADQLPRLHRIVALKDLGFTLEQIGHMLDDDVSPDQIRGMLLLRQAELEQQLREDEVRMARVAARLRQIEQDGKMPDYEFTIKQVEPLTVASIREVLPSYEHVGRLFAQLYVDFRRRGLKPAGPPLAIYYDEDFKDRDVDVEAALPLEVDAMPIDDEDLTIRELPEARMVTVMHHGPYDAFSAVYAAFMSWAEFSSFRIVAPNREIYVRGPGEDIAPQDYMTEVQFPVEPI